MKPKLIIHANCQGEALLQILQCQEDLLQNFEFRLYTNYTREHVPAEELAECAVFLYQHLGNAWGDLASANLLQQLDRNCLHLCIPNFFCRIYWPLQYNSGKHVLRDRLLEDLWQRGFRGTEFVHLATRASLLRSYDLSGIVEKSLIHERAKEDRGPIKYVDQMLAECRRKRLFYSTNHPGEGLLFDTANEILQRLGFARLRRDQMPVLDPYYTTLELPVHPGLAELFDLSWLQDGAMYDLYGLHVTYAQFAGIYAKYRASGIDSFIEYMGACKADKVLCSGTWQRNIFVQGTSAISPRSFRGKPESRETSL